MKNGGTVYDAVDCVVIIFCCEWVGVLAVGFEIWKRGERREIWEMGAWNGERKREVDA